MLPCYWLMKPDNQLAILQNVNPKYPAKSYFLLLPHLGLAFRMLLERKTRTSLLPLQVINLKRDRMSMEHLHAEPDELVSLSKEGMKRDN